MNTSNNQPIVSPNVIIDRRLHIDEISFFGILDILLKHKILIVITTLLFAITAGFYAFSIKPSYQAKAFLAFPKTRALIEINMTGSTYTPEAVYKKFTSNFNSKQVQSDFLKKQGLIKLFCKEITAECIHGAEATFNNSINLQNLTGTFSGSNPTATSEILNNYIDFINQYTINEIDYEQKIKKANQIFILEIKNKELAESYESKIQDELINLNDAITIAKNLGYKKIQSQVPVSQSQEVPIYFYGYDYLEARKNSLLKRKARSNTNEFIKAYVPQIRDNENTIANLKAHSYDVNLFQATNIDQKALTPKSPIAPKKKLIVILGSILGIMLSLFIIFIKQMIQARKNYTEKELSISTTNV
jgi:chain length determinant protein (polysaccharide antigen chain regulator)